jgi:hypothetical protein
VVITGIVQGHFTADYQGQINRTDVVLLVDDQDTPLRHGLPILADEALLAELLTDHYWRFITLTGTIVDAPPDQPGSNNRAIGNWKATARPGRKWPRNFLGHISLENFDGTQALVFTDRETAQQYILSWDIRAEMYAHMETAGKSSSWSRAWSIPRENWPACPLCTRLAVAAVQTLKRPNQPIRLRWK